MKRAAPPSVVVLAGPNGAGKSTAGPALLKGALRVTEFMNADVIAQGLSAFGPERVALTAGKVMLARMRDLAAKRVSFAFETTLAGRMHARWLRDLLAQGYEFHLVYFWLPSPEFAVRRVRNRVLLGGHSVPEATIRRRYRAGLRNFFTVYRLLATRWRVYDNSAGPVPQLIASGRGATVTRVKDKTVWARMTKEAGR